MYAKVFEQILTSSLAENYQVRHIFMDFLVLADKEGIVDMTRGAIARRLNLPLRLLTSALSALEAPDPASRSPEADGRRLVRLDPHRDWGWQIVNFKAYDKIRDEDARRENNRRYQAEHRARLKAESPPVSTCQHLSAIVAPSASSPASPTTSLSADADATKAKRTGKRKAKPTEPPKPYTRFTDYFCDEWQAKYAAKYPFKTKDGTAAAAIWKYVKADLDWGFDIIDRFFACDDKFYAGHQLTRLNADLPKFVGDKAEPNGPTVDWRPPTDEETAQIRADYQAMPKEEQDAFRAMLKLHESKAKGEDE